MDQFYFIVLLSASVILILLLTFIGVLLYSSESTTKFPPANSICPDYWTINADRTCGFPQNPTARNIGNIKATAGIIASNQQIPGLSGNGKSINFSDSGWASLYPSTTAKCAKKKWTIDNRIEWDGISNTSNC